MFSSSCRYDCSHRVKLNFWEQWLHPSVKHNNLLHGSDLIEVINCTVVKGESSVTYLLSSATMAACFVFFLISVVICLFSGAKHRAGYLASLLWWPLDAIICNNSKTEPPAYCLVGNYLLTCIWFLVVFCPFWSLCSHWVKFSHMCLGSESVCEKSVINYTSGGAKKKDIFPPLIW